MRHGFPDGMRVACGKKFGVVRNGVCSECNQRIIVVECGDYKWISEKEKGRTATGPESPPGQ